MSIEDLAVLIHEALGEDTIIEVKKDVIQPFLQIKPDKIAKVCLYLRNHEKCYFDYLSCITGIDNGLKANTLEVIYHLYSLPLEQSIVLKVVVPRNAVDETLPKVPSVTAVWKTADWHEREIYDLIGVNFENHPDLRRILMPADWEGYPLRKDYGTADDYHEIKIDY